MTKKLKSILEHVIAWAIMFPMIMLGYSFMVSLLALPIVITVWIIMKII